jgi:hypothetical protein
MQDQRSRECHSRRRKERAEHGQCTQCGTTKTNSTDDIPLKDFLANIDNRLVDIITPEQMKETKMCRHCYAVYRLRLLEMRLQKPKREKVAGMTPEQRQERMKILGQQRRERLLAENPNLCHHCLKREIEPGKAWCTFCLDRGVAANRRKIDHRRKTDKCVICKEPSNGQQLCGKCKGIQKGYSQKWWRRIREERIQNNLCLRCGQVPPEDGKKSCKACAEKARSYISKRRNGGMCQRCGKAPPLENRVMCQECAEKTRNYMKTKRTQAK